MIILIVLFGLLLILPPIVALLIWLTPEDTASKPEPQCCPTCHQEISNAQKDPQEAQGPHQS